jgi:hypothetical protein
MTDGSEPWRDMKRKGWSHNKFFREPEDANAGEECDHGGSIERCVYPWRDTDLCSPRGLLAMFHLMHSPFLGVDSDWDCRRTPMISSPPHNHFPPDRGCRALWPCSSTQLRPT